MFETALNTTWKPIAEAKAAERTNKLPASWIIPAALLPDAAVMDVQDWPHTSGFFTKRELEITEVTASEVVVKIASGEWTAVEVITAVSKVSPTPTMRRQILMLGTEGGRRAAARQLVRTLPHSRHPMHSIDSLWLAVSPRSCSTRDLLVPRSSTRTLQRLARPWDLSMDSPSVSR
jgi:hypothetical protein